LPATWPGRGGVATSHGSSPRPRECLGHAFALRAG
jgi:hypothetical protein